MMLTKACNLGAGFVRNPTFDVNEHADDESEVIELQRARRSQRF